MKKKYDLVIKVGTYTNNQGEEKGRYENVGAMMEGDNGPFIFMKRTFAPSGAPFKEGSESILISLFEPNDKGQAPQQSAPQTAPDFDDPIPF